MCLCLEFCLIASARVMCTFLRQSVALGGCKNLLNISWFHTLPLKTSTCRSNQVTWTGVGRSASSRKTQLIIAKGSIKDTLLVKNKWKQKKQKANALFIENCHTYVEVSRITISHRHMNMCYKINVTGPLLWCGGLRYIQYCSFDSWILCLRSSFLLPYLGR